MDAVFIEGLLLYAFHGATAEEQSVGRPYRVDVWMYGSTASAGRSDRLADATDYGKATAILRDVVTGNQRSLVESVAEDCVDRLFAEFPKVESVRLRLAKLAPPTGHPSTAAGVEIERTRPPAQL